MTDLTATEVRNAVELLDAAGYLVADPAGKPITPRATQMMMRWGALGVLMLTQGMFLLLASGKLTAMVIFVASLDLAVGLGAYWRWAITGRI